MLELQQYKKLDDNYLKIFGCNNPQLVRQQIVKQ